jgi:hypothetical protein
VDGSIAGLADNAFRPKYQAKISGQIIRPDYQAKITGQPSQHLSGQAQFCVDKINDGNRQTWPRLVLVRARQTAQGHMRHGDKEIPVDMAEKDMPHQGKIANNLMKLL